MRINRFSFIVSWQSKKKKPERVREREKKEVLRLGSIQSICLCSAWIRMTLSLILIPCVDVCRVMTFIIAYGKISIYPDEKKKRIDWVIHTFILLINVLIYYQ